MVTRAGVPGVRGEPQGTDTSRENIERAPTQSTPHGVVAAPADTPYHRLARTDRHRWWRPLLGTLVFFVGYVFLIVGFAGVADVSGAFARPAWEEASTNLLIAMAIPAVFLAAWWVQRRPIGSVSSVAGRLRWRWQLACAGVAALAVLAAVVLSEVVTALGSGSEQPAGETGHWVGWLPFLGAAALMVLTVPLQAAGEEYFARGWFVQLFGCYLRTPWVGITVGGVVFALLHVPSTPWAWAYLMLFSVVLGWLVIRTGGLEAAIAFHVVTNLVAFITSAAFGELGNVPNAGDASWEPLVVDVIVLPLYAGMVLLLARQFRIARTTIARTAIARTAAVVHQGVTRRT